MRFGLFEIFFPIFWPLLPQRLRSFLTEKFERYRFRSKIEIPDSDVKVFAREPETLNFFQNAIDLKIAEIALEDNPLKFSIVSTCKSEKKTFSDFIESLNLQKLKASEIVICDAGSDPEIEDLVVKLNKTNQNNIVYFKRLGINIAQARNECVSRVKNEIILFADFGTKLDPNWSLNLSTPFLDSEIDACMGWYEGIANTKLQKYFKEFLVPTLESLNLKKFMPSTRSFGIRKSKFLEINGFQENLSLTAEDSLFGFQMKKLNYKLGFSPDAVVFWDLPITSLDYWKKVYKYSKGDAETGFLFWDHYFVLFNEVLKGIFDLLCVISIGMFLGLFFNLTNFILTFCSMFLLIRIIFYFKRFGKLTQQNYLRTFVVFLHSSAQAFGFTRGLFNLIRKKELIELVNQK